MKSHYLGVMLAGLLSPLVAEGATVAIGSIISPGNQTYTGSLGANFDVISDIKITELGVFDSGGDGLTGTLTASIYDRNSPAAPLVTLNFSSGDPGVLVGGDRFKALGVPLVLPSGFQGKIVAYGFSVSDLNGNASTGGSFTPPTLNDGGGLISFGTVSTDPATYGSAGLYPTTTGGVIKSADQWNAGTFQFEAVPEPSRALLLLAGIAGTVLRRRRD